MTYIPQGRNERRIALKMERQSLTQRPCGTCTACCTTHEVPTLEKEEFHACKHVIDAPGGRYNGVMTPSGCTIYATRPEECIKWNCLWRKGLGTPEDRPDKIGAVFSTASDPQTITCHEAWPMAWLGQARMLGEDKPKSDRVGEIIQGLRNDGFFVFMKSKYETREVV